YSIGNNVDEMGQALYIATFRKQWRDVRRFLPAYQRLEGHDPMLVHYAAGGLARGSGHFGEAERQYRALLAIRPDFLLGQLELARTLFEMHKDVEAKQAFITAKAQLAGGGEQATGVLRTVDLFLAALRKRNGWQGSLAIGPGYSSNLNQSSASYTCLLATADGTCLFDRKVPDAITSTGISFEATLGRRIPLSGHGAIRGRVIAFGDIYPGHHDYSQATLTTRIGYDYQAARDAITLSPSFDLGTLGSSILYRAWGVNAEWTHTLSAKAMVKLEGNVRTFTYPLPGYAPQDGRMVDLFLTGWYMLPHGWALLGGPDFVDKSADDPVNAYRLWGGRLGISKAFGNSVSILLLGAARQRDYRAYSELFEARRRDRERVYTGILRIPALKFLGLTPEAIVQHNCVTSNIDWLYSYKRTTASLRLSLNF
ncbi:MAG: surface lipoprotein assembly modifier, partial [Sphingobium sp.]